MLKETLNQIEKAMRIRPLVTDSEFGTIADTLFPTLCRTRIDYIVFFDEATKYGLGLEDVIDFFGLEISGEKLGDLEIELNRISNQK